MIKDSGERREFSSGSVRDTAKGKGRCDLLPLGVIYNSIYPDLVLLRINEYMIKGELYYLQSVIEVYRDDVRIDHETLLLDLAKHFENGAKKYSERNWEKGQPLHVYMDSAIRHYLQYRRGDNDENHGIAFVWNIVCAMWTHENKPEMIDLPFAINGAEEESAPDVGIETIDWWDYNDPNNIKSVYLDNGMTDIELMQWCKDKMARDAKDSAKKVCVDGVCSLEKVEVEE